MNREELLDAHDQAVARREGCLGLLIRQQAQLQDAMFQANELNRSSLVAVLSAIADVSAEESYVEYRDLIQPRLLNWIASAQAVVENLQAGLKRVRRRGVAVTRFEAQVAEPLISSVVGAVRQIRNHILHNGVPEIGFSGSPLTPWHAHLTLGQLPDDRNDLGEFRAWSQSSSQPLILHLVQEHTTVVEQARWLRVDQIGDLFPTEVNELEELKREVVLARQRLGADDSGTHIYWGNRWQPISREDGERWSMHRQLPAWAVES